VDEQQFEQRLRSGALGQPRGRKRPLPDVAETSSPRVTAMAEDNFPTVGIGTATEHRWTSETGNVRPEHPFSPQMVTTAK
jgi:hypothetical protein